MIDGFRMPLSANSGHDASLDHLIRGSRGSLAIFY